MARAGLKSVVEIFNTQLKWMAVVWDDQARVNRLSFYNDSRKKALEAVRATNNNRDACLGSCRDHVKSVAVSQMN